jgi:hypothetical protein
MSEQTIQEIRDLLDEVRADPEHRRGSALRRLVDFVEVEDSQHGAVQGMVDLCQEELLSSDEFEPYAQAILLSWKSLSDRTNKTQPASARIEDLQESESEDLSIEAEWFLDLLGYVPGEDITEALRQALKLTDPRLWLYALVSLLRRRASVCPAEIEPVAANRTVRESLWTKLEEFGQQALMPTRWAEPKALAESALVRWLGSPNELNAFPEQIELIQEFPVELDNGNVTNAFLFRFREYPKPWEADEGWMAGVAGPYREGEAVSQPWSVFQSWNSKSPEEHFEQLFYRDGGCAI